MEAGFQAERSFTAEDQLRFAAFSGDCNPMHMNEVAARRTQAGTCAVHGVHAFLWALETLAAAGVPIARLATARVDFARFVALGDPVSLQVRAVLPERLEIELFQAGWRVIWLELGLGDTAVLSRLPAAPVPPRDVVPTAPAAPDLAALHQAAGAFGPREGAERWATELFKHTTEALGIGRTVSIGLLSALVGMVAPGLNSIFSNIRLIFEPAAETGGWLGYRVALLDERFRMATLKVEGPGFVGSVGAFVRFPPVGSPSLVELERRVSRAEFAGRQALVIGGSRGLGACAAKLIAAGGGLVALTYLNGIVEAEAIRTEITERYGAERCRVARYDTAADPAVQLAHLPGVFSHVYFFATGPIAGRTDMPFDRARFDRFVDVYISAFERLARAVIERSPERRLRMLYPSSVFVETCPRGMAEYAMAKAAGELLCVDLMRRHRNLIVTAPRLPRVLTDQTATVPPVMVADPIQVLLPLLRIESDPPRLRPPSGRSAWWRKSHYIRDARPDQGA